MMQSSQSQYDNLPERDLELLSAYLDNQLTAAERVNLDRRLAAEPRLRAELEELRATTVLLRQLAPVPPPRSFTLDPTTVPRPRRFIPLVWFMQLGSGLAGLALVLLATVQLLAVGSVAVEMAPAQPALEASAPTVAPMAASAPQTSEAMAPQATPAADTAATQTQPPLAGGTGSANQNGTGGPPTIDHTADALSAAAERQATPIAAPAPTAQPGGFPAGLTLALGLLLIALAVAWHLVSRRGG